MNLNIEVIDRNEGTLLMVVDTLVDSNFLPPIYITSVRDMVTKIVKLCSPDIKISSLYILGHGSPGFQAVGCGEKSDSTGNRSLQTDASGNLKGDGATQLPLLAPFMTSSTMITLGGCEVADGSAGSALLTAVSYALGGLPVRGGTADQYSLLPGIQGNIVTCKGLVCATTKGNLMPITSPF
jgi:hypothetical protein